MNEKFETLICARCFMIADFFVTVTRQYEHGERFTELWCQACVLGENYEE